MNLQRHLLCTTLGTLPCVARAPPLPFLRSGIAHLAVAVAPEVLIHDVVRGRGSCTRWLGGLVRGVGMASTVSMLTSCRIPLPLLTTPPSTTWSDLHPLDCVCMGAQVGGGGMLAA